MCNPSGTDTYCYEVMELGENVLLENIVKCIMDIIAGTNFPEHKTGSGNIGGVTVDQQVVGPSNAPPPSEIYIKAVRSAEILHTLTSL